MLPKFQPTLGAYIKLLNNRFPVSPARPLSIQTDVPSIVNVASPNDASSAVDTITFLDVRVSPLQFNIGVGFHFYIDDDFADVINVFRTSESGEHVRCAQLQTDDIIQMQLKSPLISRTDDGTILRPGVHRIRGISSFFFLMHPT